jgi:hypothetical protein
MNRGFICAGEQPTTIHMYSRNQRLRAVKMIIVHLGRIRDVELRHSYTSGQQYEAELIASIIDEAIFILETLQ